MANLDRHEARLVATVREAPGSAEGWQRVLEDVAATFRCNFAGFIRWGATTDSQIASSVGLDERGLADYRDHFAAVNPWIVGTAGKFRDGLVLPTEALVPDAQFLRSEFYNDYARFHGGRRGLAAQIDSHSGHLHLSLVRASTALFDGAEIGLLQRLVPHLRNAIGDDAFATTLRAHCAGVCDSLDGLPVAVFVEGRRPYANAAARELLAGCPFVFGWRGGVLGIAEQRANQALRARVRAVSSGSEPPGPPFAVRAGEHAYFHVQVLSGFAGTTWTQLRPPIIVVRRILSPTRAADVLARRFRLTAREAELIATMRRAGDVSRAAWQLGIRPATARVHLIRIFEKCGVRTQSQLLRMVRQTERQ